MNPTTLDEARAAKARTLDEFRRKASVVGVGMRVHTGVAGRMFKALADAGINIENITTSEIRISCILNKADGERALQVVHDAFELEKVK